MLLPEMIQHKIVPPGKADTVRASLPGNPVVVFTNGCFDMLHLGHLHLLTEAATLGDILIVGLNTDQSVRQLKGKDRPVNDEYTRAALLASFSFVDRVVLFDEETPIELIKSMRPDILVKGGDYRKEDIVGFKEVTSAGGTVITVPLLEGYSSSSLIKKIHRR